MEDCNGLQDMAVITMMEYLKNKFPYNRKYVACENKPLGTMAAIANIVRTYPNTFFIRAGLRTTNDGLGVNPTKDLKHAMFTWLAGKLSTTILSPDLECHSNINLNYQGFKMPDVKSLVIAIIKDNLYNVNMDETLTVSGKGTKGIPVLDNDDGAMAMAYSYYCDMLRSRMGVSFQESIDDILTLGKIKEMQDRRMRQ